MLSCSPCLFGPCDEALLEVKSFSLSTQCKINRSDCPRKSYQKLYQILSQVSLETVFKVCDVRIKHNGCRC